MFRKLLPRNAVIGIFTLMGAVLVTAPSVFSQAQTTAGQVYLRAARTLLFSPDNTYDIGASGANRPANVYVATNVQATNFFAGASGSRTKYSSTGDGVGLLTNIAGTDFTRLQFGGTTLSFPSLKRNSASLEARLADDSARANFNAATINASSYVTSTAGALLISTTAPTISSGFGTSPSIAFNNGTAAFRINVGTGGTATSGIVGLPAATTGWNCHVNDLTAAGAHVAYNTRQTASTTTTATFENQTTSTGAAVAWAASDILSVSCFAF